MLAATPSSSVENNDEMLKSKDSLSELVKGAGQIPHLKFIQPLLISSSAAHWILAAGGMLARATADDQRIELKSFNTQLGGNQGEFNREMRPEHRMRCWLPIGVSQVQGV